MAYLHTGETTYPIRIGHEFCGSVATVGEGVDPSWVGRIRSMSSLPIRGQVTSSTSTRLLEGERALVARCAGGIAGLIGWIPAKA